VVVAIVWLETHFESKRATNLLTTTNNQTIVADVVVDVNVDLDDVDEKRVVNRYTI
jgi:hypothetical protein